MTESSTRDRHESEIDRLGEEIEELYDELDSLEQVMFSLFRARKELREARREDSIDDELHTKISMVDRGLFGLCDQDVGPRMESIEDQIVRIRSKRRGLASDQDTLPEDS